MIDISNTIPHLHYRISLTAEAKLDLQWWAEFLPTWLGKSLILNTRWTPSPALNLYKDASGLHGWGWAVAPIPLIPYQKQDEYYMKKVVC